MEKKQKNQDFIIRKAREEELPEILQIYETARAFMRQTGNETQWGSNYPPEQLVREDMEKRQLYAAEQSGMLQGVFMFAIGADPTYAHIEEGSWSAQEPYGVIHRVASAGKAHGLIPAALKYCREKTAHLRIDTHENNHVMQHVLEKNGFRKCGIIYTEDGSPRIAFELISVEKTPTSISGELITNLSQWESNLRLR